MHSEYILYWYLQEYLPQLLTKGHYSYFRFNLETDMREANEFFNDVLWVSSVSALYEISENDNLAHYEEFGLIA